MRPVVLAAILAGCATAAPRPPPPPPTVAEVLEETLSDPERLRGRVAAAVALRQLDLERLAEALEDLPVRRDVPPGDPRGDPTTVRFAIVEAIAGKRDPRAADLLRRLAADEDARVVASASRGLGRLCGAEEIAFLSDLAGPGSRRSAAGIEGLSYCRSDEAVEALAARLDAATSVDEIDLLARAIGYQGGGLVGPPDVVRSRRARLERALAAAELRLPRDSLAEARRLLAPLRGKATPPGVFSEPAAAEEIDAAPPD